MLHKKLLSSQIANGMRTQPVPQNMKLKKPKKKEIKKLFMNI